MKRLHAWLLGFAGGAALYRMLKRGSQPVADPADDLKTKLAEARAAGGDGASVEAGEMPVEEAAAHAERGVTDAGVDDRRRSVHEQARSAIDEMQSE
jgi:hypothetical protein